MLYFYRRGNIHPIGCHFLPNVENSFCGFEDNDQEELQVRGAIKKLSAWPSSDQDKIKIVFASYI